MGSLLQNDTGRLKQHNLNWGVFSSLEQTDNWKTLKCHFTKPLQRQNPPKCAKLSSWSTYDQTERQ